MELKGQYSDFYGAFAKIYCLADEFENIFYIGCTTRSLAQRLAAHLSEARTTPASTTNAKVKKIRALYMKVFIRELDIIWITSTNPQILPEYAIELEKFWINKYFDGGVELTNSRESLMPTKKEFERDYKMWMNKVRTERHLKQMKANQLLVEKVEKHNQLSLAI